MELVVVQWPEIQKYMGQKGFEDNSFLITEEDKVNLYGPQSYLINKEWLDNLGKTETKFKKIRKILLDRFKRFNSNLGIDIQYIQDGILIYTYSYDDTIALINDIDTYMYDNTFDFDSIIIQKVHHEDILPAYSIMIRF